jgi:hypothetical protein
MQNRITIPSKLLNEQGELIQKGYATSLLLEYSRKDVKYRRLRLKEWDYYLMYNDDIGFAITIGKSTSILLISATFFDFKTASQSTQSLVKILPTGKLNMPESSEVGDIKYHDSVITLVMKHEENNRILNVKWKNFEIGSDLIAYFVLSDEPIDSMVIATPFVEDKKAFYYNQKIIGMRASGKLLYKGNRYRFPKESSFGLLDWGRGVWPYKTTWYWSAAQGFMDGHTFGFNFGYGFGDTTAATENMLFYDGLAYKLEDVFFIIPKDENNNYDYLKPWTIISSDNRVELEFFPILDRNVNLNAFLLSTNQHQVFGHFKGQVFLDVNTVITLDNFLGFAERVENKW